MFPVIMGVALALLKTLDFINGVSGTPGFKFLLAIIGVQDTSLISSSSASFNLL